MFQSTSLLLTSFFLMWGITTKASERIVNLSAKRYQSNPIYLSAGLVSFLNFPCEVELAVVGNEANAKAILSPSSSKIVIVNLVQVRAQATNLIVKCQSRKKHFVFDLIPSRVNHQDVVYINSNGSLIKSAEVINKSSERVRERFINVKEPRLIKRGGS